MFSYADRAKPRPRNYPTDPHPCTSLTNTSASTNSTAPSSVTGTTQSDESRLDTSPSRPSEQSASAVQSAPAASAAQSTGDATHSKTLSSPVSSATNPTKVNVWTQRAQARALSNPVNAKTPSSAQVRQSNSQSTENAPSNAHQIQPSAPNPKNGVNGTQIGGVTINEQEWPEVGPSSGTVTRSSIHTRTQSEKDAEHSNTAAKKEKPKWVTIAPSELKETADQLKSTGSKVPPRGQNRHRNQAHNSQAQTESKSLSSRNSPNRPNSQLLPVNTQDRSSYANRQSSRPHSQLSSVQNSPLRQPGNLSEAKVNGVIDGVRGLVLQGNNTSAGQSSSRSSRHSSPSPLHVPVPVPAPAQAQAPAPTQAPVPPLQQQSQPHTPPQGPPYPYNYYPTFAGAQPPMYAPHYPSYSYTQPMPPNNYHYPSSNRIPPHTFPPSGALPPPNTNLVAFTPEHSMPSSTSNFIARNPGSISPVSVHSPLQPPAPIDLLSRPPRPQNSAPVTVNTSTIGNDASRRKDSGHIKFGSVSSNRSAPSPVAANEVPSFPPQSTHIPQQMGLFNGKGFSIGISSSNGAIDLTSDDMDKTSKEITNELTSAKWVFGSISNGPENGSQLHTSIRSVISSELPTPSTLELASEPNTGGSGLLGGYPPVAESSPTGSHMRPSLSPSWDQMPKPQPMQNLGGDDFEVRNYGYGVGLPYTPDSLPRQGVYQSPNVPNVPYSLPPPPPPPSHEYDPYSPAYYYPQFPLQPPHFPGPRPHYSDANDGGRWRGDLPYGGYQDYDTGYVRDRPPRGRGRRSRGINSRGFGRVMRGTTDRPRDFHRDQQYYQQHRQDGPRPPSFRSPERPPPPHVLPMSPEQPYQESYGYYGYPPVSPYPYINPNYSQPIPLPVSNLGYTLDPTRMYLLGQVEYYFSVQNLARDTHLRRQMDTEGWVSIQTIASFNRVRTLAGGASPGYTVSLVKDVCNMSTLVEVDSERDRVRLTEGKWRDFLLPCDDNIGEDVVGKAMSYGNTGAANLPELQGDVEGEDTDDDIEFVMGRSVGSPAKREQPIPPFVNSS